MLPCEGESNLCPGDALHLHWRAGGGYGDPLLRSPESVRDDVRRVRVSADAAEGAYGAGRSGAMLAPIGTPELSDARKLDDNLAVRESPDGGTVAPESGVRRRMHQVLGVRRFGSSGSAALVEVGDGETFTLSEKRR